MKISLWVQKLSDDKLKELLLKIESLEILGGTDDEELITLAATWYDDFTGMDRFMHLSIDIWKEAASRWEDAYDKNHRR